MLANYHTHTARCRHAQGTEEAYVQSAIARGLKLLGFSDHTPQWFPGSYYSHMRMFPHELEDYCTAVRRLQEAYRGQLEIPLGLEVEYYPALFSQLLPRLQDSGIEYMILGQHWVGNEENEPYCGAPTQDEALLKRYCAQVRSALDTGLFTYLAHPDLLHFTGSAKTYARHMRPLCQAARQTSTPLELNFLGLSAGRHYPNPLFWELAAEEGCDVVFGIDAHTPEQIQNLQAEAAALEMAAYYHLNLLQTLPLRSI